jgi:hypothetical protein
MEQRKIWFKAKRYGYGWYPCTWQGWLVIGLWLILFIQYITRATSATTARGVLVESTIPILVLTALLIMVAWGTGEKARWRWG